MMKPGEINRKADGDGDILAILRELDAGRPLPAKPKAEDANRSPDPHGLLASLQKKDRLISLLDGYVDKADIATIRHQLKDAITDLEEIIKTVS